MAKVRHNFIFMHLRKMINYHFMMTYIAGGLVVLRFFTKEAS